MEKYMSKSKGNALVTTLVVVGIFVAIIGVAVGSYISNYNYGNRTENQIVASSENNENILAQYSLKISDMAQVPTMYKDDVKEVYTAAITGRYGADGSKAMFQWLKEKNPDLDPSMYVRLQQAMEAGRNKFENAQTELIDIKRGYKTNLGYLWKGMWLRIAGYPKLNLDKYKIITSTHAQETFSTGVDKGINLR